MENQKVAIVTGSGAGIGKAIALRLAADGYAIVINDIREENAQSAVQEVQQLGVPCLSAIADVTNEEQVKAMVDRTIAEFGRVDVLVNNAGICPIHTLDGVTPQSLERTFHINVTSQLVCTKAVVEYMKKQGGGRIICAASQSSFRQTAVTIEYATTKWAIRGLVRCLAESLAPFNINVNGYCPGTVWTEMQDSISQQLGAAMGLDPSFYKEKSIKDIPLGRLQTTDDVAAFVSFLASDGGVNITGQCVLINGGAVMN